MHSSKDDFKWFGEGFDGFPKRLPDDCVEYAIYILDPVLQDSQIRERLRKVHSAANVLTKHLLKGFIWQREPFGLELVRENGKVIRLAVCSMTLTDPGWWCRNKSPARENKLW